MDDEKNHQINQDYKQRRYNLYMQTRSPEHEQNFKDIQKQRKKAVRQAKESLNEA